MVTSLALDGTPEEAAAFVLALINQPTGTHDELHKIKRELRDANRKLDEILEKLTNQALDQTKIDEIFAAVGGSKGKLDTVLADSAETENVG